MFNKPLEERYPNLVETPKPEPEPQAANVTSEEQSNLEEILARQMDPSKQQKRHYKV